MRIATRLGVPDLTFIPLSALEGDNVVERSKNMPWYHGESVLEYLEDVYIGSDRNLIDFRLPVQCVVRPNLDFRGFSGQIASGIVQVGDEVVVMPSMKTSRISSILSFAGEHDHAFAPMSVTVTLEDEIDISRGDMLVHPRNLPRVQANFEAMMVWLAEEPMHPDDIGAHKKLADAISPTRIALGEHVPNRVVFKNMMQAGAVHFIQVDCTRVAGISEFITVSMLARRFGLPVVPHVGDMGQIHQHLVLFNHIALGHEALFLECIPHLQRHFVAPAKVENGVYLTPQFPGSSSDLHGIRPGR